jgi:hypothetical protein
MSPKKGMQKSARSVRDKASEGFTSEERAATRERAQELKSAACRSGGKL